MGTSCYALVRGSALRVTGLGSKGTVPDVIEYAVSKAVARVQINEVTEGGSSETLSSDDGDNDNRLQITRPDQTLYYTVDIDFLRCDPGVLSLITGAPLVYAGSAGTAGGGFGEAAFGEFPFGDGEEEDPSTQTIVGFDSESRQAPVSFALEVWSKLAGNACEGGVKQYGYTVLPFLKGGRLTSFKFENGLVSFNIRGAQTRQTSRWVVGPYDLHGPHERLVEEVSRNTLFRQTLTTAIPPTEADGIQETEDVIYGGSASVTSDDAILGGSAAATSDWIIYGGQAA